ncbi:MAG: porin [Gammaproteobacteria bacterium]|nr:porin [Gammaproteobacteria bacterium]
MKSTGLFTAIIVWLISGASAPAAEITAEVGGRLHVDGALYDEDVTDLASGTEFRRARIFVEGALAEDWSYKLEYDFADEELKDAFAEFSGLAAGSLQLGHFKQAFSLEELTSSRYITFMERALPNVFVPSRRIGAGYENYARPLGFAAGVFGNGTGDSNEDEGVGAAGRLVFAPEVGEGGLLHLGLAATWLEPETTDPANDSFRIRQRPESHVTDTRLIDTGTLEGAKSMQNYGFEAAWNLGSLSLQGEYVLSAVDTSFGDFDFDGWYAYGSWFPGGESRPYKDGAFQRVEANDAWELALRYSSLDLDDGAVAGGKQDDITVGVNYYVNPYLRFMFNYVRADVEGGINGDEEPNIYQVRVSFDF